MFYCKCFIFLFQREISELRRPIGAKFYTTISSRPHLIMPVQNFGSPPPEKNRGPKTCKIWFGFCSCPPDDRMQRAA